MSRIRGRIATVLVVGMLGATLPASAALAGPGPSSKACQQVASMKYDFYLRGNFEVWRSIYATVCSY